MDRKFIVVFDICSSTQIISYLHESDSTERFQILILFIIDKLKNFKDVNLEVYKYMGDGFILIVDEKTLIDDVLRNFFHLIIEFDEEIHRFHNDFLHQQPLKRLGLTVAIDKGFIYRIQNDIFPAIEYFGKPISVASRLQGKLSEPNDVNKVLVSGVVHSDIENKALKSLFVRKPKILRNMYNDQERPYYELDAMYFSDFNLKKLHPLRRHVVENILEKNPKVIYEYIGSGGLHIAGSADVSVSQKD